jgi:hypothetical protein
MLFGEGKKKKEISGMDQKEVAGEGKKKIMLLATWVTGT